MSDVQGLSQGRGRAPIFARASRLIGASRLDRNAKSVLRALLQWWNPKTGELWPSMRSIAEATGFTVRGVQKIIRRLEASGVLIEQREPTSCVRRGAAMRTKVFRIDFSSINPLPGDTNSSNVTNASPPCEKAEMGMNCRETILKNDNFSFEGERGTAAPRTTEPANPERGSSEACKSELSKETLNDRHGGTQATTSSVGCLDAMTPALARRHELVRCGVRGRILLELSNSDAITLELIRQELSATKRDRTCRNISAVLVSRLASIAGIELHKRRILNPEQRRFQELIERRRREFGIQT